MFVLCVFCCFRMTLQIVMMKVSGYTSVKPKSHHTWYLSIDWYLRFFFLLNTCSHLHCWLNTFFYYRNARFGIVNLKTVEETEEEMWNLKQMFILKLKAVTNNCTYDSVVIFKSKLLTDLSSEGWYAWFCTEQLSPLPFAVLHLLSIFIYC